MGPRQETPKGSRSRGCVEVTASRRQLLVKPTTSSVKHCACALDVQVLELDFSLSYFFL